MSSSTESPSIVKFPEPQRGVQLTDVKRAARNIASYAHRTPVLTCQTLNERAGHQLFFKCENLQKAGAFKFRGAVNSLAHLKPAQLARGVITHSSGNHAGALALAAKLFKTTAYIVMPSNSNRIKREAVLEYGGKVISCNPNQEARAETARLVQQDTGAVMVPPYNHPHVIAGQGTVALEFLQQVPNLDFMVAPVGGGGLISGLCVAGRAISNRLKIIAAEPEGADDAFRSKAAGKLIPQTNPQTIADGLLTSLGDLTWPYVQHQVHSVVTVSDEEIIYWMRTFWERTKVLIEPSSAVALAAVFSNKFPTLDHPKNIGIVLGGGNVDLDHLPWQTN